jgi:hypothetical protein
MSDKWYVKSVLPKTFDDVVSYHYFDTYEQAKVYADERPGFRDDPERSYATEDKVNSDKETVRRINENSKGVDSDSYPLKTCTHCGFPFNVNTAFQCDHCHAEFYIDA